VEKVERAAHYVVGELFDQYDAGDLSAEEFIEEACEELADALDLEGDEDEDE
jgi:predicted NBD/HSP70 family sugar kinase